MFGCGKLKETEVLLYLERQWDKIDSELIDAHIKDCQVCLGEITELSRINAVMDSKETGEMEKPKAITLVYKFNELARWFGTGVVLKPVSAVSTRTQNTNNKYDAEISILGTKTLIRILAQESGDFWINIHGEALRNAALEVIDQKSGKIIFACRSGQDDVLVKGIPTGSYKIKMNEDSYYMNINTDKAGQIE